MPKRSRKGRVIRPDRVVAPTSVNGGQVDAHRTRTRPLADDQVELKILHRRVEDFLDRGHQPVDLVDEQDVVRLQIGQQRGKVAGALYHRPGGSAEVNPQLARHNLRQCRLAEAWWTEKQHMVERLVPAFAAAIEIAKLSRSWRWPTNSSRVCGRIEASAASCSRWSSGATNARRGAAHRATPVAGAWANSCSPARISASILAPSPSRRDAAATAPNASARR